jgi:RND family efflux transporter MFP subunit
VGDPVEKDQILVEFDTKALSEELENARVAEKDARSRVAEFDTFLTDVRRLEKQKVLSIPEMLRVMDDLGQARLELSRVHRDIIRARHQLDAGTVRAPFAGIVTERNVTAGVSPKAYSELLVLSRIHPLELDCTIAESDLAAAKEPDTVEVTFSAHPNEALAAEFKRIVPVASEQRSEKSGTLTVLLSLPNPHGKLLPGMTAIARIDRAVRGLRIPSVGLINAHGDSATIFAVDDEGTARLRTVRTGRYAQGYTQVLDGLRAGERVVVVGQAYLRDGDAVEERGPDYGDGDSLFPSTSTSPLP